MNCPKCGSLMRKEGLASMQGEKVFFTFECPSCHYRTDLPAKSVPHFK